MKKNILGIILLLLLSFFSCGTEPPYIASANYYILIYQQDSVVNMLNDNIYLSLFCVISNDNDDNNIKEMKITHMDSEYSWTIEAKNLTSYIFGDTQYIGFPFIEYEDGKALLTGNYLIEVTDKTDNVSDYAIEVSMPNVKDKGVYTLDDKSIPFTPKMVRNKKELVITSSNKQEYNSAEIKFVNNPSLFGGGRKKFMHGERMIFDANYHFDESTQISVRLNTGELDNIIYYLRPLKVEIENGIVEEETVDQSTDTEVTSDTVNNTDNSMGIFERIKNGIFKQSKKSDN